MLRNLNREFRANGLPDEWYSPLVRNGAVMHMKNTCSPSSEDVKIGTPGRAVEAAARIGAETTGRITATGVWVLGDPALSAAVLPPPVREAPAEPRVSPEVAAQALYGALAAAAARPAGRTGPRHGALGAPDALPGTREGAGASLSEEAPRTLTVCALTHSNSTGARFGSPSVTWSTR
ncbi:hypothetical protein [Streptomyces sp. NPDC020489]|uniref:hypothetical protein n=1 Tax=Streptomyces sp. NPDC020489 TaxID=3365077 RepID=UPI0037A76489